MSYVTSSYVICHIITSENSGLLPVVPVVPVVYIVRTHAHANVNPERQAPAVSFSCTQACRGHACADVYVCECVRACLIFRAHRSWRRKNPNKVTMGPTSAALQVSYVLPHSSHLQQQMTEALRANAKAGFIIIINLLILLSSAALQVSYMLPHPKHL